MVHVRYIVQRNRGLIGKECILLANFMQLNSSHALSMQCTTMKLHTIVVVVRSASFRLK